MSLQPARALGVLRIIFFGFLFYFYINRSLELSLFGLSHQHWRQTFWFELLNIPRVQYQTAELLWMIWIASMGLSAIGLFFRVSSLIAATLGWFILNAGPSTAGDTYLWNYSTGLPVLWMLVFAFSNAHHKYALDSFIFNYKLRFSSFDYIWPLLLMRVLFIFPFFFSSFNRFKFYGIELFNSNFLFTRVSLKQEIYCHSSDQPISCELISYLLKKPQLLSLLYDFSQLIEIGTLLLIFLKSSRLILVPCLIGMQIGIDLLLFENFLTFTPLYFVWIPIIGVEWKDFYYSIMSRTNSLAEKANN